MMRRYPTYRDSGVEWMGEVPEGWNVVPVKRAFSVTLGKMLQNERRSGDDFEAQYLRAANVQWGRVDVSDVKRMWFSDREARSLALMVGDLLVSEGGDVGRSAIWQGEIPDCFIQNSVHRVRALGANSTGFLYYWMLTLKSKGFIDVLCNKSTIAHFTVEKFSEVSLPRPPLVEQTAIAAFLDRETAKIDALVDEQRRLIALLREKRQAVISQAVTKGLNPAAPMKPSGVDWLGDVPDGWEVSGIKRYCREITDGAHVSPETEEGVYPFVSTKDISENGIDLEGCLRTSGASFRYLQSSGCQPFVGDILFSKDGTIGRTAIVELQADFVVASSLIILRPRHELVLTQFLNYLCRSSVIASQVSSFVKGAGLPRLSISNLLKVFGVFPEIDEQVKIVDYLNAVTANLDNLAGVAESGITLLQERRAALISAAVTGKIDVRDLARAKTEAA